MQAKIQTHKCMQNTYLDTKIKINSLTYKQKHQPIHTSKDTYLDTLKKDKPRHTHKDTQAKTHANANPADTDKYKDISKLTNTCIKKEGK